ncbi:tetratricopeptide repeat protein,SH3 domain-containing protein [Galbibacter orientalis DSM 19592]|uniref:Tetratricopeptide repeat protein,SH3 domain-containing protein n=1 Tax=Galbibacter orientalis DSM 19592 TaxID=926559 RepID=I3C365_9FLAO|nr:tetratricopeptide repeat protein [Galbibacter orientalis]EIJ38058.1 tetratricopeptide repeat protein,SH3 domain-containing protein [Galbibacter orientalis DSM 19592]
MMKACKSLLSGFVFTLFLLTAYVGVAQNEAVFKQGNDLYNEGKYQKAIEKYLEVSQSGVHSAALYYNLANGYYKLNQIAPSIYYYEKALLLSPNDADIKNNLHFAENMTVDAIDVMPQTGLAKLATNIIFKLSYNTWAILSILFMVLFVVGFLLYYFASYHTRKRIYFALSILFLLFSIASYGFSYYQYGVDNNRKPAIIFAKETSVMSEPNMGSTEVFLLHEGTKVNILETLGGWKKIKLADGKIGWLPDTDLKEIKDF